MRLRANAARAATISASMDARTATRRAPRPRAAVGPGSAVLALALAAALLLVLAELSTIASVDIAGDSCEVINDSSPALADRCSLSGWERHGGALILLAALAVGAGLAARRGSLLPAGGVLAAVGVVVLGIALLADLPVTNETGAIGLNFDGASGSAGLGFYLELTGGALALLAGALVLLARLRSP
jgi:hypothetical protein